jgi:hypothetical protein
VSGEQRNKRNLCAGPDDVSLGHSVDASSCELPDEQRSRAVHRDVHGRREHRCAMGIQQGPEDFSPGHERNNKEEHSGQGRGTAGFGCRESWGREPHKGAGEGRSYGGDRPADQQDGRQDERDET